MDLNLDKHRPLSLFLLFLTISIFLLMFQGQRRKRTNSFLQSCVALMSPVHKTAVDFFRGARYLWLDYVWLTGIRQENRELKNKIEVLKSLNNQYIEAVEANKRLRKLLDLRLKIDEPTIPAEIIGKDSTNWCKSILLDKGSKDGLIPNMPVVSHNGVVGKTHEVTAHTAKVLLMNDVNSSIAILIQRNRAEGILVGSGHQHSIIKYFRRDIEVRKGDRVITSGMGGIFPKGLLIGTVSKIQKNTYDLFQYIEVMPEVQISELEEVFIIQHTPVFPTAVNTDGP